MQNTKPDSESNFFQKLWAKKVPQYVGTYMAVGFGLFQFLDMTFKRYNFDTKWVDKYLILWLVLLPSVIIVSYFGKDLLPFALLKKWRTQKIVILTNLVAALVLVGTFFNTNAATKEITVTNENGVQEKLLIPNKEKIKNIACFQFKNETNSEENNWWGIAFSSLLTSNLEQRPEFYCLSIYGLLGHYGDLGLPYFSEASVGKLREMARQSRNDYFTDISFTKENNLFSFNGKLHQTKNGKAIIDIQVKNKDPFEAIDEIREIIFKKIPNPLDAKENVTYLPSSSLITNNKEALKHYTLANMHFYKFPSQLEKSISLMRKAFNLDTNCAACSYQIGDFNYGMGNKTEAIKYLKTAIKNASSLPERLQFGYKLTLYSLSEDLNSYYQLSEIQRKKYPYEFSAYQRLISYYQINKGVDSAKQLIQEAIDNGNIEKGLLQMYNLQMDIKAYSEAEKTLNQITKQFPDRKEDNRKYADVYEKQGKLDASKAILIEEEILNPFDTDIQLKLVDLELKNTEIEKAMLRLEKGLEQASTLNDSIKYMGTKISTLMLTGRINDALKYLNFYETQSTKIAPLVRVLKGNLSTKAYLYLSSNQPDRIKPVLEEIKKYKEITLETCNVNLWALLYDFEPTMKVDDFKNCTAAYESYGSGFNSVVNILIDYQSKNYKKALQGLTTENKEDIQNTLPDYFLCQLYYKGGDKAKAVQLVEDIINKKSANYPYFYYLLAYYLKDTNPDAAKKHLETVLKIWKNADADFIPLQRAQKLEKSLNAI